MHGPSQFDRVSTWLRGQHRTAERVGREHETAADLVSTAEYELGKLRRELSGLPLEPGDGVARLADVDTLAAKTLDAPKDTVHVSPEPDRTVGERAISEKQRAKTSDEPRAPKKVRHLRAVSTSDAA